MNARDKELCARCPVADECRDYALQAGDRLVGIWGGLSGRERRRLLKARRAS